MTAIAPTFHAPTHHPITAKKPSGFRKKIKKIGDFFKGTDGWDELGSGIGQTLPGIGQHIATLSILSVLTPFVYLGVKGMASEMDEAKEDLHEIQETKKELLEKINNIFDLKLSPDILGKGINTSKDIAEVLAHRIKDPDFEEKVKSFATYANHLVEEKTAKIAHHATPYGLAAMTGMLGGMVTATLRSGAEIASTAHPTIHALETTALALEIATAGLFIPAQIAMMIYAGKKVNEGKIIRNKLNHDKASVDILYTNNREKNIKNETIEKQKANNEQVYEEILKGISSLEVNNPDEKDKLKNDISSQYSKNIEELEQSKDTISANISEKFYNAIQDNLDRKLHYNKLGKIIYGRGLAVSEAGMVVGGALSFAPIANAISPAILVPSAVATIGFAGLRIYAQNKEGKFTGNAHDHVHNGSISHAWKDTFKRAGKSLKNKIFHKKDTNGHTHNHHHEHDHHHHHHHHHHEHTETLYQHNPAKEYETEFNEFTDTLARQKLNSLTVHALSSKKPQEKLEKMISTGRKSFFKRTTLQKDVLEKMRDTFSKEKEKYSSLIKDSSDIKIEDSSDIRIIHTFIADIFQINHQDPQAYMNIKKHIEETPKLREEFGKICRKHKRNNPFECHNDTDTRAFERAWDDEKILKAFAKSAISHEKNTSKASRQGVIDEVVFQANIEHLKQDVKNLSQNHNHHH